MKLFDGIYDKKELKRKMHLTEFKKFLQKKYGRKFIVNNNKIFDILLYKNKYEDLKQDDNIKYIRKLHKIFMINRNILSNKLRDFIEVK